MDTIYYMGFLLLNYFFFSDIGMMLVLYVNYHDVHKLRRAGEKESERHEKKKKKTAKKERKEREQVNSCAHVIERETKEEEEEKGEEERAVWKISNCRNWYLYYRIILLYDIVSHLMCTAHARNLYMHLCMRVCVRTRKNTRE